MDCRRLTVQKDHRGCVLFDGDHPITSFPSIGKALELARTLAVAHHLRAGPPLVVEVRHYGRHPRRVRLD
ncbi:hypothetical protein EIM48_11955 [Pseudoxanthomonas sp. SGNA-20]|jgi:hypothetical protein|uniref:Uncharacterized protein n=1 Tax=Pseudoxanthomonas taiwanensis J19 TaxID=935569 RepID=A0A562D7R3_9GAMM|nr:MULTISPECIES: hypothetical protein [Pseudoxanthomonas]RRN54969.1 hypothetical protein EIM48_11955 [Pseudoxanthomonas sp. SGNA-20]RRN80394.1 hypothetical protein EIM50_00645 [Pseudoxanthomonas sp. SGD-10]TWH05600.1 hypothetical protein L613_005500000050 [Pseudoxanthomonas taiwanensis J19]